MRTIIIYSTIDGHTFKICNRIKEILIANNQLVEMVTIDSFHKSINEYDKIIIASSIRYGKHNSKIIEFINENTNVLNEKLTAFFSVNLVARKLDKDTPSTNPYLLKFMKSIKWCPTIIDVFAGKLDYKKYSFGDKLMIKLIMLLTKGPINSKHAIEFTNWNRVDTFGRKIAEMKEINKECPDSKTSALLVDKQ